MQITDCVVPLLFAGVMIFGAVRRVDVFPVFCEGAAGGLKTTVDILPALVLLLVSVGMLRASGAVELLTGLLEPLCNLVGFPPECMQMVLLRPFSGSGIHRGLRRHRRTVRRGQLPRKSRRSAARLLGNYVLYGRGILRGGQGEKHPLRYPRPPSPPTAPPG